MHFVSIVLKKRFQRVALVLLEFNKMILLVDWISAMNFYIIDSVD